MLSLEALQDKAKYLALHVSWAKTRIQMFEGLLDETMPSVHACGEGIDIL